MHKTKVLLLCASPRRVGTSAMLLRRVQQVCGGELLFLYSLRDKGKAVHLMAQADRIVLSGPCYINSYLAVVSELMEEVAASGLEKSGQSLYGIINGGMPYPHTHRHGLTALELFADAMGMRWQGGFVLGAGVILDGKPLEHHPLARKTVPAFAAFCEHIRNGTTAPDALYEGVQIRFNPLMTRLMAAMLNRRVNKHIRSFGHDPYALNAYINPMNTAHGAGKAL